MDFQTSIVTCLKKKYFTFQGRASRSEFWFFFLFTVLVNVANELIFAIIPVYTLYLIVSVVSSLAFFIPNIAVTARRLHDTNHTGWWQIFPAIPIILGATVAMIFLDEGFLTFPIVVAVIIAIAIFVFLIRKGTEGDNRFGPSPFIENWENHKEKTEEQK